MVTRFQRRDEVIERKIRRGEPQGSRKARSDQYFHVDLSLSEMLIPVLLVASLRARVLSLRAKHLFVAATVHPGLRSGLAQRDGSEPPDQFGTWPREPSAKARFFCCRGCRSHDRGVPLPRNEYELDAVAEAKRLAKWVDRPNLMVKVPARRSRYRLDRHLVQLAYTTDASRRRLLTGLRGKVATKLAYQRYTRRFAGPRWEKLRAYGARVQRVLWASTSTKTPGLSDVLYVEELIGRDTINTMPPATIDAFRDHGRVRPTLEQDIAFVGHASRIRRPCRNEAEQKSVC